MVNGVVLMYYRFVIFSIAALQREHQWIFLAEYIK